MSVDALRAELARLNELAPSKRMTLTPDFYTSPEWATLERQQIFRKEWICVGRVSEFKEVGEYRTFEIDAAPFIVVRRRNGQLAAMSAVCLHRMALIAQGAGCVKGFTCPYHGWTYDLEGRLISAPGMPADFKRSDQVLPKLVLEEWNGFVYVNLNPSASSLNERLAPLTQLLAPYHMERMQVLTRQRHTWRTNWKILVENFLEAYHVNVTHPTSLAPFARPEGVGMLPGAPAFQFYQHRMADSFKPVPLDPRIGIPNADMDEEAKRMAYVGCVFPTHLFSVTWDAIFWLSLQPRGLDEVDIDVGLSGPFDLPTGEVPDPEHPNLYYLRLIDAVNAEDRSRVESIQRGARSGFGRQSVLHRHEATISGFISYLFTMLDGLNQRL
jgi:choline monooxygenase